MESVSNKKKCFVILEPMNHMWLVVKAAKDKGFHVVVAHNEQIGTVPPYDIALECVDQYVYIEDWFDIEQVVTNLSTALAEFHICGTYAAAEYTLEAEAATREAMGLPGNTPELLEVLLDKRKVRELLQKKGLTNAKTYDADAFVHDDTWLEGKEMFFKPRRGSGSALVTKVSSAQDLRAALAEAEKATCVNIPNLKTYINKGKSVNDAFYLEEALKGELVSVECLSSRGKLTILGITNRSVLKHNRVVEMGACFPFESECQDKIYRYVNDLHKALGYVHGASHIELMVSDNGDVDLVEFNARFVGADVILAINAAYDIAIERYLVDLSTDCLTEFPDTSLVHKYASLQYILAPDDIDTFESFTFAEDQVTMLKLNYRLGDSLSPTRNQIDQLGGFMVVANSLSNAIEKAEDVRRSLAINGKNIRDDANNQVCYR